MASTATDGEALVFSLCHELGNLVCAIRLNAELIDAAASPVELARAALEIDDSSARMRSWLALVRPLLDAELGPEESVSPGSLVRGVAEALNETGLRGVEVEVGEEPGLGSVRGRRETLHHLLLTLAFLAVEEVRPRGRVRVAARAAAEGGVAFWVEDDGPADPALEAGAVPPTGAGTTGRSLARQVAEQLLTRLAGSVSVTREGDRTRVRLRLPLLE